MASILILRELPSPGQVAELLRTFETFIKLAIDIQRQLVAAGGEMHYSTQTIQFELRNSRFAVARSSGTNRAPHF